MAKSNIYNTAYLSPSRNCCSWKWFCHLYSVWDRCVSPESCDLQWRSFSQV